MGARESSPTAVEQEEPVDTFSAHFRDLYADFTAPDHLGAPVDQKIFRNRFENYFGGPYLEFGHALYAKFFSDGEDIDEGLFVSALTKLRGVSQNDDYHLVEQFYFSVFANGEETISRDGLATLLHIAATYAMVIGSELHEKAVLPKDHHIITSLVNAAWVHADKTSGLLQRSQFGHWVSQNCPGLLDGVRQWTQSLITHSDNKLPYQLPSAKMDPDPMLVQEVELCTLIWVLSTALPMVYMGHTNLGSKGKAKCGHPVGGDWTCLYSSDKHGLSMNRFQHHCSDYKHPSVLTISCYSSMDSTTYQFAIALDTEWRDGTYYFGGENFVFVQLGPTYHLLKRGPKLVSLNERQRGFPTGLRVIESGGTEMFKVDSTFEQVTFLGGDVMKVECVEVWGCGGMEGAESQRRLKEWEKRQILLRRKVKTAHMLETWEGSPDRYLLELGGVTTRRATEQQQQ